MDADTLARLSRLLRGRPEDVDNLTQQELVLIAFGTGGNAATIARAEELNEDTEAALRDAVRSILSQRVEARRNRQHGYQCAAFGCVERATRLCSSCGCAAYCSRACQKESWQAVGRCAGQRPHRETCAEAAAVIGSLRQQPDVQQDLRDSGPGTAFRCKELLIFMCGLVSYPMHGVDNVDGMHKLLDAGADSTITASRGALAGECVLYLAVCMDNPAMVEVLCSYPQTDVDQPNLNGTTPLFGACQHNHVACVRVLLSHGANPNARQQTTGGTPLHVAAAHGYVEIARILLDLGAGVDGDIRGHTPLMVAASRGDGDMVRILSQAPQP